MTRNPKISVIVPIYNVEEYLGRCVDSILTQSYENLEVILVDDGAKDRSGQICDDYARLDSRVRVIHKENGGLSSARNAGIDAAQGEYLSFVDSDDFLEPQAYGWMMELAERYDVSLVCGGRYDVDSRTGQKSVGLCPQKEECVSGEELAGRIFLWDNCDSSACDKLYHRSLWQDDRYPLGRVCEDLPVTYRIALKAGKAALCPRPVYNYFHRPQSISMSSLSEKTFHFPQHAGEVYAYIREHHPAIEPQARFLRVRSLYQPLVLLEQASSEQRSRFWQERQELRRELRKHLGFVLNNKKFSRQEQVTDLLLVLGLYRWLRPLFHRKKS